MQKMQSAINCVGFEVFAAVTMKSVVFWAADAVVRCLSTGGYPYHLYFSYVNKPPYATMFGARFYCALTLHVSAPIGGHLQELCDKIYSKVAAFMSTDPLSRHIYIYIRQEP
jgi:hypothetical protein